MDNIDNLNNKTMMELLKYKEEIDESNIELIKLISKIVYEKYLIELEERKKNGNTQIFSYEDVFLSDSDSDSDIELNSN